MILFECPVCNYLALHQRGKYEICPVCGWEDEGDEAYKNPSEPTDGPNGNVSLDETRNDFKSQKPYEGRYKRIVDLAQDELNDFRRELENDMDNDLDSVKARKQLLEHIIAEQIRRG